MLLTRKFEQVGPNPVFSGSARHWIPLSVPGASTPRWSVARRVSVARRATNKRQFVLNVRTRWQIRDAWIPGKVGLRNKGRGEGTRYGSPDALYPHQAHFPSVVDRSLPLSLTAMSTSSGATTTARRRTTLMTIYVRPTKWKRRRSAVEDEAEAEENEVYGSMAD
jgi:hypothetical protein